MKNANKTPTRQSALRERASHAIEQAHKKEREKEPRLTAAYVVRECFDFIEKAKRDGLNARSIAAAFSESIAPISMSALESAYRIERNKRIARAKFELETK